jgi:thioredoxin 1
MSSLPVVDDNSFDKEVLQSSVPVVVEFGATWCGPCQRQLPLLEKLQQENADTIKVVKVDIDDAPTVTAKYGVRSVPTMMLFVAGEKVETKVGLTNSAGLNSLLEKAK